MKLSSVLLALFTLASTGLAKTTCTPSFDYCADVLTKSKGWTSKMSLKEPTSPMSPFKMFCFIARTQELWDIPNFVRVAAKIQNRKVATPAR
ncbi:hypothetical protein N7474_002265, partial [Penicillium riverlandense]|uniref:uncharacterized protein n=1 Tax=Penicillium riverlandense TaxID=1903569 RepID=UPI00254953E5